nr:MAG TPA: hypothetical protein [Caudoviricetes sp.]
MTRVLWVSRHTMTQEQSADLKRIYGADVEVKQYADNIESAKQVVELGSDCDVLAVVLPPAFLADLTNPRINTKPVIRAIANRVATGKTIVNPATGAEEPEMKFEHAGWERIMKVEIVTEKL